MKLIELIKFSIREFQKGIESMALKAYEINAEVFK